MEERIPRHSATCLIDFEKEHMRTFILLSRNDLKERRRKLKSLSVQLYATVA